MANPPTFSNVKLLCHFNGANLATSTTDSSTSPHTLTRVSTSILDTSVKKYGSASSLQGGSDGWSATDSADWAFGSGQFTVEGWIRFDTLPVATRGFVYQFGGASDLGWWLGMNGSNLTFYYSITGTDFPDIHAAWSPSTGTFYHVAVDRDASNVLRLYVDGAVLASATVSSTFFNSTRLLNIGGSGSFTGFSGNFDDVRITKGEAVYGGAFTPPGAELPDSDPSSPVVSTVFLTERNLQGYLYPVKLRTWTQNLLSSTLAPPLPFSLTDWPVPPGYRRAVSYTWTDPSRAFLAGQESFFGAPGQVPTHFFPNPIRPYFSMSIATQLPSVNPPPLPVYTSTGRKSGVSYSVLNWRDEVVRAWGNAYGDREIVYDFAPGVDRSAGHDFEDSGGDSGIYNPEDD